MLKTLIIATVLLPTLAFAQQQLPQPRRPGEWCPVGWSASGNYCVPASDKAPSRPQKRMVPGGLARERQLLHPVKRRWTTNLRFSIVKEIVPRSGVVQVTLPNKLLEAASNVELDEECISDSTKPLAKSERFVASGGKADFAQRRRELRS